MKASFLAARVGRASGLCATHRGALRLSSRWYCPTRVRYAATPTDDSAGAKPHAVKQADDLNVPTSPLNAEEVKKIVRIVENDPRILMEVLASLEPENRRRLIVTGGAMEWFGKESALREVEKADLDKDLEISPKDFDHWFSTALKRRQEEQRRRVDAAAQMKDKGSAAATKIEQSATAETPAAVQGQSSRKAEAATPDSDQLPFKWLALIALEAGLPFVGFGFLDNATMILAGDFIDGTIGLYFHCSVLASAAMGNVCSGVMGMQVHGLIDKAVRKLNFNTPVLTDEQMNGRSVFLAGHIGGTVGILLGLILGMLPLLFLDGDTNEKADYAMFRRWDNNGNGFIELPEFEKVLAELGFTETHEQAKRLIRRYGENQKVNFEQFSQLKSDMREGRQIFD